MTLTSVDVVLAIVTTAGVLAPGAVLLWERARARREAHMPDQIRRFRRWCSRRRIR